MRAELLALLVASVSHLAGTEPPTFEIASVKSAAADHGVQGGCHGIDSKFAPEQVYVPPLGRCVITNGRLSHLVMIAWDLPTTGNIRSGPDWIARGTDRYTIQAQADDRAHATEAQLLGMLQNLLIDRFQMKFHREMVEMSGFALVIAKNGPKLRESKAQARYRTGDGRGLRCDDCSCDYVAEWLSGPALGTVVDKTGLSGRYDIRLTWDNDAGPTLNDVLQEQLGLRLVRQKVSVSLFVIESAQKPGAN